VNAITLQCVAEYSGAWESLTIQKQFKDGYEPIAVATPTEQNDVEVVTTYPNITYLISETASSITMTLNIEPFRCIDLTNYTCTMVHPTVVSRTTANINGKIRLWFSFNIVLV